MRRLFLFLLAFAVLVSGTHAFSNPEEMDFGYDDGFVNSVFDIRTDRQNYDGISQKHNSQRI